MRSFPLLDSFVERSKNIRQQYGVCKEGRFAFSLLSLLSLIILLAIGVGGCTPVGVTVGSTVGVAAVQERGLSQAAKDLKTESEIVTQWLEHDSDMFSNLGVEAYKGRVLITGFTATEQQRAEAIDIAWQVGSVREVINEILILESQDFLDLTRDSWISTQLKSAIVLDSEIFALNYVVETVNRTVYLIGIGQNQKEINRVIDHARNIKYVRNVINHVENKEFSENKPLS